MRHASPPRCLKAALITLALAIFLAPASALAASSSGTVLSVARSQRVVQVVDASGVVHAYHYRQMVNVKSGSRIRFKLSGQSIATVRRLGRASEVCFYAKVLRTRANQLVLRLADGNDLTIAGKQLAHANVTALGAKSNSRVVADATRRARSVAIGVDALQQGETVLVTESTAARGNPTVAIELTATPGGGTVSEQQVSGVVTDVESDMFAVMTADGSILNLNMAQDTLAGLNLSYCDSVTVSYHEDQGALMADSVQDSGASTSAACAGDSSSGTDEDAIGAITSVSGSSVTIDQGAGQGTLEFTVDDPSITDGFDVGDVVDVTYTEDSDGSLDASDVEYVEDDATGVVIAVGAGSLTVTDDSTGNPDTFTADPGAGMFDGVEIGDEVDVTYHVGVGVDVVDNVDDSGPSS